jgi:murein L,D-transpeptidase YcbB/YkuD
MHDTPNKNLFKFQDRTFSHGCIRVENAYKLAKYILQKENNWNEKLVDSLLIENKEKAIDLKQKLQIYITYFTTWVNEENQLLFANDVYNLKQ